MLWPRVLGTSSVPVLCYHNIGGNGVPEAAFRAQMAWLRDAGVSTLGLAELREVLQGRKLDGPSVCLTFDDGFRDLYTRVAPTFRENGQKGIVFAISGRLRADDAAGTEAEIVADKAHRAYVLRDDRSAWLSTRELRELSDEGLLEVGSHSATHAMIPVSPPEIADIPDHWAYAPWAEGIIAPPAPRLAPELSEPAWLNEHGRLETEDEMYERALENFTRSREELEAALHRPVTAMAWPWGKSHPVSERAALDAGLDMLFPLRRGAVKRGTPEHDIPRLEVRRRKGMGWFKSRVFMYSHAVIADFYSATRI